MFGFTNKQNNKLTSIKYNKVEIGSTKAYLLNIFNYYSLIQQNYIFQVLKQP